MEIVAIEKGKAGVHVFHIAFYFFKGFFKLVNTQLVVYTADFKLNCLVSF